MEARSEAASSQESSPLSGDVCESMCVSKKNVIVLTRDDAEDDDEEEVVVSRDERCPSWRKTLECPVVLLRCLLFRFLRGPSFSSFLPFLAVCVCVKTVVSSPPFFRCTHTNTQARTHANALSVLQGRRRILRRRGLRERLNRVDESSFALIFF